MAGARAGDEAGDGVLVFAAPGNERGLGDVELGGEAGERPALDAEVNETLNVLSSCIRSFRPELRLGDRLEAASQRSNRHFCGLPNWGRAEVTGHSPGARNARPTHTPLHRRRTKRNFGSSHTPRPAGTARRSREPRPRLAVSLPANPHCTAVRLTWESYPTPSGRATGIFPGVTRGMTSDQERRREAGGQIQRRAAGAKGKKRLTLNV